MYKFEILYTTMVPTLPISLIPSVVAPPPKRPVVTPITEDNDATTLTPNRLRPTEKPQPEGSDDVAVSETPPPKRVMVSPVSEEPPPPDDSDGDDVVVSRTSPPPQTNEASSTVNLVDTADEVISDSVPVTDTPTAEMLNNTMSLKQLKDRCIELGMSTAGKKMDLAERIASP